MSENISTNHKLSDFLKGRAINGSSDSGGQKSIQFDDGSTLTVKVAASNSNSASTGGKIAKVRQSFDPPTLHLDMEGGGSMDIPLAEATYSVTLRSEDGKTEYAD